MGDIWLTAMTRIHALVRFNRRERLRKKFALYLLLALLTTIVFEEGESIIEICEASSVVVVTAAAPVDNIESVVKAAQVAEIPTESKPQLTIEEMVRQAFGDQADNALKVMQCESQGQVDRIGDKQLPKPSIGLFQINTYYNPEYSSQRLTDPNYNIQVAHEIYLKGGWGRWTCGRRIIYNESI